MSLPPLPPTTVKKAAAELPTDSPPTPTVTHYEALATEILVQLETLASMIPKLEGAHTRTVNFVRGHQNVPDEFLMTVVKAVEQIPELQRLNKLDAVAAKDALQFNAAFKTVRDRLETLLADVNFTARSNKAAVASNALQIYVIAQGLARDAGSSAMLSLVKQMKRDLGRRGPKGKPEDAKVSQPEVRAA